ncbi:hypothetical protein C1X05_01550 [Laceyella sacchari]|uniref:hypothetical protein n=1 Tax=Laceyella tengchongensis TaxID=574699 RepID=UPI000C9F0A03|nr:hypothetical protein [Laceyella tengchongensis]AUS07674.1 hypothetical protein C1X05_01550 [Laceyella sacchari]
MTEEVKSGKENCLAKPWKHLCGFGCSDVVNEKTKKGVAFIIEPCYITTCRRDAVITTKRTLKIRYGIKQRG